MPRKQWIPNPQLLKNGLHEKLQVLPVKDYEIIRQQLLASMDIGTQHTKSFHQNRTLRPTPQYEQWNLSAAAKVLGCTIEEFIRETPKTTSHAKSKPAAKQ